MVPVDEEKNACVAQLYLKNWLEKIGFLLELFLGDLSFSHLDRDASFKEKTLALALARNVGFKPPANRNLWVAQISRISQHRVLP